MAVTNYEQAYRALREGLEALADDWDKFADADWFDHTPREHADHLRALLVQPSLAEGEDCQHCDGRGIVDSANHRCAWCRGSGRADLRALLAPSPAEGTGEAECGCGETICAACGYCRGSEAHCSTLKPPSFGPPVMVDGVVYSQKRIREIIHERHRMGLEIRNLEARLERADRHLRLRTSALVRLIARKGPRVPGEEPQPTLPDPRRRRTGRGLTYGRRGW